MWINKIGYKQVLVISDRAAANNNCRPNLFVNINVLANCNCWLTTSNIKLILLHFVLSTSLSRCVFGVGSCLVGYVYSRGLVLFWASLPVSRLHSWSPVMSVCLLFWNHSSVSTPPRSSIASGSTQFHVRFLPSRLTRFQAVPHLHGHYLLWIM